MANIFDAMIIGNLSRDVSLLKKWVSTTTTVILDLTKAQEDDDKRLTDLHEKVRNLEKEVNELRRDNKRR